MGVIVFVVLAMLAGSAGRWNLEEPIWCLLALSTFALSAAAISLFVPKRRGLRRVRVGIPCGLTSLALALGAPLAVIATAHHEAWAVLTVIAAGFALMRKLDQAG